MKIRDIVFDLTAFLDVILVLLFLVLTLNTGEMLDYRARLDESDIQLANMAEELAEAETTLAEAEANLAIEEMGALNEWRVVVENAVNFIFVHMQISDDRRVIVVEESPDILHEIEIVWAEDGRNIIVNERDVLDSLNHVFSEIIESKGHEYPIIIMFNTTEIAIQEYRLATRGIRDFISDTNDDFNIYHSSYAAG
jgi:hypothetical protein